MDEAGQLMRTLILGVAHLCTRVRSLAESGDRRQLAVAPVRESLELARMTLDALEEQWRREAASPLARERGTSRRDEERRPKRLL
jgi:hypothetical protein